MKELTIRNMNGEYERINAEDIETRVYVIALDELEKSVNNQLKCGDVTTDIPLYIGAIKVASGVYQDEYDETIDEIADRIFVIEVDYDIDDEEYTELFLDFQQDDDCDLSKECYRHALQEEVEELIEANLDMEYPTIWDDDIIRTYEGLRIRVNC